MRVTFAVSSCDPEQPFIADMTFEASTAVEIVQVLSGWLEKNEDYYIYEIKSSKWYTKVTPMDQILGPL